MSEQLINDLREAIASSLHKPLIICGAGVSMAASNQEAPSWLKLLESGIARVVALDPDDGDWAAYARSRLSKNKADEWVVVADEITKRLGGSGNAEFSEWIEASVGHLTIQSTELIDTIKALSCPIATTNYDDLLSSGLGVPSITWDDPDQVHRFLRGDLSGVLHLHGHWRKPRTVILGSTSYETLNSDPKKQILSAFSTLQTPALYIGCSADGLSDPDFTHIAAFVTEWQQTLPRSYWLVRTGQRRDAKSLLAVENPRLYPIAFGSDHGALTAFLRDLRSHGAAVAASPSHFPSIEQQEPKPEIFGREDELQALEDALASGRSAVIGGGPGFGKTALAITTLYREKVIERFGERRVFVSLEAEREPRALLVALATVLGLPSGGEEASLLRQIQLVAAEAPLAAILDNAEHVIETSRTESERILRLIAQIPGLSVAVTTRGSVPQLPGALAIHDLTKLSAAASRDAFLVIAGPHFQCDADLATLLETLDGHALSIELVAARAANGASLAGIKEAWQELRATILKRMGEAEGRLTSVRASLALSLDAKLLTQNPLARRLLALLAVLPAGLPQGTVPRVLGDRGGISKAKALEAVLVLQQLKLVEKRFDDRLRMLTPLREAARLDLATMAADRHRLIDAYCKIAQEGEKIGTSEWESVRKNVEVESGNFDTILRIAISENYRPKDVYLAIGGVSAYFRMSGQGSTDLFELSIQHYQSMRDDIKLASIHGMIASIALYREDLENAKEHYKHGLDLSTAINRPRTQANCYSGLGKIEEYFGNLDLAENYFRNSIDKFKELNDIIGQANQINKIADLRIEAGDAEAESLYEESRRLYEQVNDQLGIANAMRDLAECRQDDLENVLHKVIESYKMLGTPLPEAASRNRLAFILQSTGRYAEALDQLDEASRLARQAATVVLEAFSMIIRGITLRRAGDPVWRTTIADGFDLLRMKLRADDRTREGYKELEGYLTAENEEARSVARERTRRAWTESNRLDCVRDWLELPIC